MTLVAQTATHRVGVCFLVGLHDQLLWYAGMVAADCVHTCSVSCRRLLELVPRVVKGDNGWPRTTNEQHDKHHNKTLHWYRPTQSGRSDSHISKPRIGKNGRSNGRGGDPYDLIRHSAP